MLAGAKEGSPCEPFFLFGSEGSGVQKASAALGLAI